MSIDKKDTTANEIKLLFDSNELNDLKRFMRKRKCLNSCSIYLLYLFHLVQTTGIFMSSIGASLDNQTYLWIGISLNMIASLLQIYEKINYSQLKKLLADIQEIKDNKYVDEDSLVEPDKDLENGTTATPPTNTLVHGSKTS
jgi:hypothetical protein